MLGIEIMAAVVVLVLVVAVVGRKTFGRFLGSAQAQANKAGRAVWGYDPVAIYQKQIDDATGDIREAQKGQEQYGGLINQMKRRVDADTAEVGVWDARARGYLTQGNDAKAADSLSHRNTAQTSLESNSKQLAGYQMAYDNGLKRLQFAVQKIEDAKGEASKLSADLKMSQTEAELSKLASSLGKGSNALDGLGETREEIQRQIDGNLAKAQVNNDLGGNDMANFEAEKASRTAAASGDLEKLRAEMGLGAPKKSV